jgi:DNA-binding winged helix-turn-helix (wHTH) protein
MLTFPPFRLDLAEERLWRGEKLLAVRRKPFAILRYLAANPKRLVTHDELLRQVWGEVVVSESAVRSHLHDLRQALGDGVIETVIGRGYRFTAEVAETARAAAPSASPARAAAPGSAAVVGRGAELAGLHAALDRARAGQRQLCFVTGDPGIGKTTLINTFLDELEDRSDVAVARGQCVEQHGTPEAYLAVIEVLVQLCRSAHGPRVLAALLRHAPTFLMQVPHLVPDAQLADVQRRAGGEARMARELVEAFEQLAIGQPLVIVLEDLQWSDVATIDLLALLGHRRERAQLLVVGTSRRAEAQTVSHPLNPVMRALVARSGATGLGLERITAADVQALIDQRFPGHAFPDALTAAIDAITGGTPLFVVSFLDDLAAREMLVVRDGSWQLVRPIADVAAHRPDSVRQMIDIQLDRLTLDEQRVLEAASTVGSGFVTELVAAALEMPVEQVEEICEGLARRSLFLRREASEDWPDGTIQARYALTHALVREMCIARGAASRSRRWHRLVAERLETAYGARANEIAHVLAAHFDQALVAPRAIDYYLVAAERDRSRSAGRDALRMYRRAKDLLVRMPDDAARAAVEMRVLGGLTGTLIRIGSEGSDTLDDFERLVELATRSGDPGALCGALITLAFRHLTRAEYRRGEDALDRFDTIAGALPIPAHVRAFAASGRAIARLWQGDLAAAIAGLDEILALLDGPSPGDVGVLALADRTPVMLTLRAVARWAKGELDGAMIDSNRAFETARALGESYTIGMTAVSSAFIRLMRRESPEEVLELVEQVLAQPGAEWWHLPAQLIAWCIECRRTKVDAAVAEAMVDGFRRRVAAFPMGTTGVGTFIADTLAVTGWPTQSAAVVEVLEAAMRERNEGLMASEILRIRGTLLEPTDRAAAIAHYRDAVARARASGAGTLALRAAAAWARLDRAAAQPDLAAALAAVREGLTCPDVTDARALLDPPA